LSFGNDSLTYQIRRGKEITIQDLDLNPEKAHAVALSVEDGRASLFLDGRLLASVANFNKPDIEDYVLKIGLPGERSRRNEEERRRDEEEEEVREEETEEREKEEVVAYPGIQEFQFYSEALSEDSILEFTSATYDGDFPESTFEWHPGIESPRPIVITAQRAATEVIDALLKKVFRRPPTKDEFDRYLALFNAEIDSGAPFEFALQLPVTAALSSPAFLLRYHESADAEQLSAISSTSMASRLSYFLWSSTPDDELLSAGVDGELLDSEQLLRQTDRMLADERADRFFERFVVQWLRTEGLGDTYKPDADLFPEVSDSLMAAMRQEGVMVFGDVIREDRSLFQLLEADSTFMNQELATHYGFEDLVGSGWQRVQLADASRGGLLTQAAVLTVSSSPRRTSPVFRGKWVLDVLLGEPPPPPPPNVPELPSEAEAAGASLREILAIHRSNPVCAACHDRIDPYGLALEQYDAVGRLRPDDRDTSTTLYNGEILDGVADLKRFLLEEKGDTFIRHLTQKMLAYALGRELKFPDERSVQLILAQLEEEDYRARSLIRAIVLSDAFRFQKTP